MNAILKTVRFSLILGFILYLIYLFAKFLFLPIFLFIIILKLFRMIKVKFKSNNKKTFNNKESKINEIDDDIIDGEFKDLE
tara:strand:- start:159 stop:401 length:243 start_codon:yes stop_codon:yes gene_type:complete